MCRMFEHMPWHGIQLVLNSVDHILTGIVMQQDYAVSESMHRVKDQLNAM
jgi:hypothetical protein